jgi:anhydro-N-acetylmuramic acid kinase
MSFEKLNVLGLMSGTSMDGIDCSLLETNGITFKRSNKNLLFPYKNKTLSLLHNIVNQKYFKLKIKDKILLEKWITEDHADAVKKFQNHFNCKLNLIGFHGQTIFHDPQNFVSIQIGNGNRLAELTATNVVSDFRKNDMDNGGQGAPLAPIFHQAIMKQEKFPMPTCFINIGGVSNLTWWDGNEMLAFDAGPGNGLIDLHLQNKLNLKYDHGGNIAFKGKLNLLLTNEFLKNKYFQLSPPKSLDRLHFDSIFKNKIFKTLSLEDTVTTLASLTLETIVLGFSHFKLEPKTTVIMGGGQHNKYLVSNLKQKLSGVVVTANEVNLPGDFVEAELMAYLAARRLYNLPITFPSTTGVKNSVTGGKISKFK